MTLSNPQYITDNTGKKLSVVLPVKEYERIIRELENRHPGLPHSKSHSKVSELRGKMTPMTNEQIDQQFNDLRNEWKRDI